MPLHPDEDSEALLATLLRQVRQLISQRKGVRLHHLHATTDLPREFGFAACDMVDLIGAVESHFGLSIAREAEVRTPGDFARYLAGHLSPTAPPVNGISTTHQPNT